MDVCEIQGACIGREKEEAEASADSFRTKGKGT